MWPAGMLNPLRNLVVPVIRVGLGSVRAGWRSVRSVENRAHLRAMCISAGTGCPAAGSRGTIGEGCRAQPDRRARVELNEASGGGRRGRAVLHVGIRSQRGPPYGERRGNRSAGAAVSPSCLRPHQASSSVSGSWSRSTPSNHSGGSDRSGESKALAATVMRSLDCASVRRAVRSWECMLAECEEIEELVGIER